MKASVKYGLIGSGVVLATFITQYYLVDASVALHPAFMYLIQISILVSIVASIKVTKDREIPGGAIDLKSGLRAGVSTVFIITIIMGSFFFFLYKTMSSEKHLVFADRQFADFFKENPVLDTGEAKFQKAIFASDSSFEKSNFGAAKMHLEVAKQIKSGNSVIKDREAKVNPKLIEQYSSSAFVITLVFQRILGQLLTGVIIAFFTTMIFRYKYKADNS